MEGIKVSKSSSTLSPALDSMQTESPAFFREEDYYLNTDIEATAAFFFPSAAPPTFLLFLWKSFIKNLLCSRPWAIERNKTHKALLLCCIESSWEKKKIRKHEIRSQHAWKQKQAKQFDEEEGSHWGYAFFPKYFWVTQDILLTRWQWGGELMQILMD